MKKNIDVTKIEELKQKTSMFVTQNRIDPFYSMGNYTSENTQYWKWGDDNLFPYALSLLSRRSTTHRRIINDKADYISGKGVAYDKTIPRLSSIIDCVNSAGDTLRQVINKLAFDKALLGNAFLEIVTDENRSFLSMFHQDATRCRLSKDKNHIMMHHNWMEYSTDKVKKIALYPKFEKAKDGTMRSIIHYKDYEPMYENYGIPSYVAGMNVSAIAYKTDKWNISRLDNSFQLSGIMVLDADIDSDSEAENILRKAESKFAGKPGQVMFLVKGLNENEGSKFIPISSSNEGDWKDLHSQATTDIVVAHSWFRSLSGLDYSGGFSADRIINEYEVALNTVITGEQQELLEPIRSCIENIMGVDATSIQMINTPPIAIKPGYMKIWEARKADGYAFDENDPEQQNFLANISKYA